MKKIQSLIIILLISNFSFAQIAFQKTYGGALGDGANYMLQTSDNGYIIAGHTFSPSFGNSDGYLIKTDSIGNIIWRKIFGGSGYENAYSAVQISNGFIILGSSNTPTFDAPTYLLKYDFGGNLIWSKGYSQTIGGCNSIRITSGGGFILAGGASSVVMPSASGVGLMKLDSNANVLWARSFGTSNINNSSGGSDVSQTFDSGYIISGYTNAFVSGNYAYDIYLIKTDSTGHAVWKKTYGGSIGDEVGNAVRQTSDSGYVITGSASSFTPDTSKEVYLVKTDNMGNLLWSKTYRVVTGGSIARSVQQTSDGGYIIGAYTLSIGAGLRDFYLIKTDGLGNLQWSRTYGGANDDEGYSAQQTSDGGYVIGGYTTSFGLGPYDIYLIKTDSAGNSGCNEALVNSIVTTPATIVGNPVAGDTAITVQVSNPATQVATGGASITLCIITGEEEVLLEEIIFSLYPNPSANEFSITSDELSQTNTLEIYNSVGERVLSETFSSRGQTINVSFLPAGIYWCRIISEGKKILGTRKLVVMH